MEKQARAHLIVHGRVQGVYYRAETQMAATRIGVCGWVRNRRDGTVEAVAEGPENDVAALIEWCKNGPPRARVDKVDVTWQDYRQEFTEFSIRY